VNRAAVCSQASLAFCVSTNGLKMRVRNAGEKAPNNPTELAHFTAEAGNVYYFRWRFLSEGSLLLAAVDSEEAEDRIATFPLSVPRVKKISPFSGKQLRL
jgi:hypothetical protein